jgi:predicted acyl esterase
MLKKKKVLVGLAVIVVVLFFSHWITPWLPIGFESKRQLTGDRVTFKSEDGVTLVASVYKPKVGVAGKVPMVVMLSPYAESRHVYADLAVMLKKEGIGVLTVDVRGSGETGADESFGPEAIRQLPADARASLDYARALRWVDANRLALLGTGVTANTVVLTAVEENSLAGLVLISGVFSEEAKELVRRPDFPPLLLFSSYQDEAPTYALQELKELSQHPATRFEVYFNAGIGSQVLFSYDSPEMKKLIVRWLRQRFAEGS